MNRRPILMLALTCWMGGSAVAPAATPAPAAPPPDLAAVSRSFDDRLAAALTRYSEKLDAIYARHRESGDLDAVLAVRAERARFLADGAPTEAGRVFGFDEHRDCLRFAFDGQGLGKTVLRVRDDA